MRVLHPVLDLRPPDTVDTAPKDWVLLVRPSFGRVSDTIYSLFSPWNRPLVTFTIYCLYYSMASPNSIFVTGFIGSRTVDTVLLKTCICITAIHSKFNNFFTQCFCKCILDSCNEDFHYNYSNTVTSLQRLCTIYHHKHYCNCIPSKSHFLIFFFLDS